MERYRDFAMPRKPRFYLSGVPVHVVQRGDNRHAVFHEDDDYQAYLGWLQEGLARYEGVLHAYVLMTNHADLLITLIQQDAIIRLMQHIGCTLFLTSIMNMVGQEHYRKGVIRAL